MTPCKARRREPAGFLFGSNGRTNARTSHPGVAVPSIAGAAQRSLFFIVRESWVLLPSEPALVPGLEELGAEPAVSPAFILSASLAGDALFCGIVVVPPDVPCAKAGPDNAANSVVAAIIAGIRIAGIRMCFSVSKVRMKPPAEDHVQFIHEIWKDSFLYFHKIANSYDDHAD
ncbi:MAG: hypothetical protein PGN25_03530 [Methylorubrum populi]